MIIAVDGPSASGKGSVSRRLADHFGLSYLDTGLLYRAVGKKALDQGRGTLDPGVAELVARELTPVRDALLALQRDFAHRSGGAVLDGRDIGTVVCPKAEVKLYITASPQARAHRRYLELRGRGEDVDEDQIYQDILKRDRRDQERSAAPLRKADDAHLLDTTNLDIEQAFKAALGLINAARASGQPG